MTADKLLEALKGSDDLIRKEAYHTIGAMKDEIEKLQWALKDARGFAEWVECLGRTDCEIYRHELKIIADLALERIERALGEENEIAKIRKN